MRRNARSESLRQIPIVHNRGISQVQDAEGGNVRTADCTHSKA